MIRARFQEGGRDRVSSFRQKAPHPGVARCWQVALDYRFSLFPSWGFHECRGVSCRETDSFARVYREAVSDGFNPCVWVALALASVPQIP